MAGGIVCLCESRTKTKCLPMFGSPSLISGVIREYRQTVIVIGHTGGVVMTLGVTVDAFLLENIRMFVKFHKSHVNIQRLSIVQIKTTL